MQLNGRDAPSPMSPLFDFEADTSGGKVTIHDAAIRVADGPPVSGRMWLRTVGELDIRWSADVHVGLDPTTLTFVRPGIGEVSIPAHVTNSSGRGFIADAETPPRDDLAHVIMHWFNLPAILPAGPLRTTTSIHAGRWTCVSTPWKLTLDQRLEHQDLVDSARETSRMVMTHVGKLERADGADFSSADALDSLAAFQAALSFATGGWVAPALPVGYTRDNHRVWEHWANWRCAPYHGHFRWWDNHRSGDLEELCRCFIKDWTDPVQHSVIRHLAFHSISASSDRTTLEARIMLAQAGLEYLGWVKDVLEGERRPKEQRQREAQDILRDMLKHAQITTAVPPELSALTSVIDEAAVDGPRALTWLRNRLVHPKDASEPYRIKGAVGHAWLLSTHYLDLLILHRINYGGRYLPRIPGVLAHASEPAPWSLHSPPV